MAHEAIKEYIYSIHEPVFRVSHVEWEETGLEHSATGSTGKLESTETHFFLLGFKKKKKQ